MLHNAKNIIGFMLTGSDGDIGNVREFYFDDLHWTIRYMVVDTGHWLKSKNVLISPRAISSVDSSSQRIVVNLTKQQIEDSPSWDSDKPVSRQFEDSYHKHYGWPIYWDGPYVWGSSPSLATTIGDIGFRTQSTQNRQPGDADQSPMSNQVGQPMTDTSNDGDCHLRSTDAVGSYAIFAPDGPVGNTHDFIIDDSTWTIRYLIVTTGGWFNTNHVLIATQWLGTISYSERTVFTHTSRLAITQAPKYSVGDKISREYETVLHEYYQKKGYWHKERGG